MHNETEIILNEETEVNEMNEIKESTVSDKSTTVNWKHKLSSRKLWAAILAAVFALLTALFGEELPAEMVEILKTGIYGLIAYIFGEGVVDVARILGQSKVDAAGAVPININFSETGTESDAE